MPYTIGDFRREYIQERLQELPDEEREAAIQEIMEGLSPEQRLAGLPAKELAARLSPEERLAGMSASQIEAYLKRLRQKPSASRKKKPKRKS